MAKSDREKAQRGPENLPEPHVVDPDEVVLAGSEEDGTGKPAAGPELSVSAEELTLAQPRLAPARISEDAAETAALDETAEEARAAADEAEEAGVLAAGPVPGHAPAVAAEPSGTAPAGGTAGDAPAGSSAPAGPAGSDAAEAPGAGHPVEDPPEPAPRPGAAGPTGSTDTTGTADPSAESGSTDGVSPVPVLAAAGGSGLFAGTDPAAVGAAPASPAAGSGAGVRTGSSAVTAANRPSPQAPRTGMAAADPAPGAARPAWAPAGDEAPAVGPRRARSLEKRDAKPRPLVPLVLGAVVVLALLVWGIISVVRGFSGGADPQTVQIPTAAGADGVIAENVAPSVLTAGQCLLDFTGISNEVTIVTCTTPHRAQLIASEFYPDDAGFPGREQLGARAKAACDAADINSEAASGVGRIELLHVTPTEGTWADEDRRVDCFAVVEEGETLSRSLLNE